MVRCFIAIDLPESIKDSIMNIEDLIEKSNNEEITFIRRENLHLTLAFIGEIDENKIAELKKKLKEIKIRKFKAKLSKLGVFPSEKFIRVLWVGLESERDEIFELRKDVEESLKNVGILIDKNFESHITLARIKFLRNKEKFIELNKKIKVPPIEFDINAIKLKKSELTTKGSIYEDLLIIDLN